MRTQIGSIAMILSLLGCAQQPAASVPAPAAAAASQGSSSTDIYLYKLSRRLPFGRRLINITNRPGYDNQPSWDGSAVLYTVGDAGQTDIYRYKDGSRTQYTATPESEYSAALTPDYVSVSVIRVEKDSTQRLWQFPKDGRAPSVILKDIKPVGYYAWLDSTQLALFVLGNPNTLQIADTRTGIGHVVTTNIGRSLQRVPGGTRASYLHRAGTKWVLETVDPMARGSGFAIDTVVEMPDSADFVAWRSPTELYTAAGSRILRMRLPDRRWLAVVDLADQGIRRISRLALSPDGATLAFVADEPKP
jgi:hypothetical protein